MIGIKYSDIDKDVLMIFTICYEYSLSFTNMLKLFAISRKYFWTFMEICSPMLKMGVRKAATLKKSVDKMYPCIKDRSLIYETLTPREDNMLEHFTWFIEDCFTDGEGCLHISQIQNIPFARAFMENGLEISLDHNKFFENVDRIKYVKMGDDKFYKTSRFLYYMERYSGDTDVRELDSLSIKEMLRRIQAGEEKLSEKEKQEFGNKDKLWV